MLENFETDTVFENRMHEKTEFSFNLDGKVFKGQFYDDGIHWLQPHPRQEVDVRKLEQIESEIFQLLGSNDSESDDDDIDVQPFLENQSHEAYQFSISIEGEEFKGIFHKGELKWFRPKPRRKIKDEKVEKIEEDLYKKIQSERRDD